jgi:hypothetical protein
MPATTYIVLRIWESIGEYKASTAESAIRQAVKDDGTYVAVPVRSFKPVRVQSIQTTTLKLEQPDTTI